MWSDIVLLGVGLVFALQGLVLTVTHREFACQQPWLLHFCLELRWIFAVQGSSRFRCAAKGLQGLNSGSRVLVLCIAWERCDAIVNWLAYSVKSVADRRRRCLWILLLSAAVGVVPAFLLLRETPIFAGYTGTQVWHRGSRWT